MRLSKFLSAAFEASCLFSGVFAVASTDTLMDGDSSQSGYLPNHNMDPAVIAGGSFGQIWSYSAPGGVTEQFFAKPLVFTPSSTGRQIVLSFSEQNRIYALDAVNGTLYAMRDLALEGEGPFSSADLGSCADISGTVGVTGTPVIDPTTDTVYFWAKSYLGTATGYQNGAYRFHAIDAVTLKERPGFPVNIQGTPADNDHTRYFTGGTVLRRPSLNLVNGVVFAGFGGHCDQYNFTGWVVGMSASTGKLLTSYVTSGGVGAPPQDGTFNGGGGGAGIWMAGAAIASDQSGRIFFATGNAYKTEVNQNNPASGRLHLDTLSECVVNMAVNASSGVVTQQDYFEPYTYLAMDKGDRDLGSGGVCLPDPATFSGGGISRLAITAGKNGVAYIMNADNLGGYKLGPGGGDAIVQTLSMPGGGSVFANVGTYPLEGGYLYITPVNYYTIVYKLGFTSSGMPAFTQVAMTPDTSTGRVGTGPATITTNKGQAGSGILWVADPDSGLRAYYAVPSGNVMTKINLPSSPALSKFQRPAFGDGRYYLSTTNGRILAFGSPVALPLTCTSPVDFGSVPIGGSKTLNVTCTANIPITKITGFVLGKAVYTASNSSLPTGSLAVGASFTFPVMFDLTNHVLNAGSTSSPSVSPGVQTTSINIATVNGVTGFAPQQPVTVTGRSISQAPFLEINPLQVDFAGIVVGSAASQSGSDATFVLNNVGLEDMTILGYAFTTGSISSPNSVFTNVTTTTVNGTSKSFFDSDRVFSSPNLPPIGTVIKSGGSVTVSVNFKTSVTGTYYSLLQTYSDGGNEFTIFSGSGSTSPVAVLEYSNGEGGWNPIPSCANPSAGCGYEVDFAPSNGLSAETIQLRLTNTGGSILTITKSKPLEGVELGATNPSTDFSEGTIIAPGNNSVASVLFSPGPTAINADDITYSGAWTLNTDDLTFGVHTVTFIGKVVSTKVGPVNAQGKPIFKYLGCYQDYLNNVRLESKQYVNANNTNGLCQTQAQTYLAAFAGTEYMSECWVGSIIPPASALAPSDFSCNYQCVGDASQTCGGFNGFISIYYDTTRYFPANNSLAAAPGGSVARPSSVGAYNYAGCYSDSQTARVLSAKTTTASTNTLESCATFCAGYTYFGTEYGNECYCANTLASTSVKEPDTDCNMNCAGNTVEFCGAGSRISLFVRNGTAVPTYSTSSSTATATVVSSPSATPSTIPPTTNPNIKALGCYSDNDVTMRTLIGGAYSSAAMTIESCGAYCQAINSTWLFGTEYASECYCGPKLASTSSLATDGRCSMACSGNKAEICGGSYGMNIFTFLPANSTTSSVKSSSSSTFSSIPQTTSVSVSISSTSYVNTSTTAVSTGTSLTASSTAISSPLSTAITSTTVSTTSSVTPTPTLVGIPPVIGQFTYQHCHSDNTTTRTLNGKYIASPDMTLENCAGNCTGFAYFGVEYYSECYCGNTLSYGSFVTTDGRCNMKCYGNANEICGGNNGLTLYSNASIAVTSSSSSISSSIVYTSLSLSSSSLLYTSSLATLTTQSSTLSTTSSIPTITSSAISSSSSSLPSSSVSSSVSSSTTSTLSSSSSSSPVLSSASSSTISSIISSSTIAPSTSSSLAPTSSSASSTISSSSSSSSTISSSSSSLFSSPSSTASPTSSAILVTSGPPSSTSSSVSSTSSSVISSTSSSVATSTWSSSSSSSVLPTSSSSSSGALSSSSSSSSSSTTISSVVSSSSSSSSLSSATSGTTSSTVPSSFSSSSSTSLSTVTSSSVLATSSSNILSTTPAVSSSSSSSTAASTTKPSSTLSTVTSTSSVAPSASSNPWAYIGCASDNKLARALTGGSTTSTTVMTPGYCQAFCQSKNLPLAGIEFGSECYCGYSLSNNSTLGQTGCTKACAGSATTMCGGSSRLSVYSLTTFVAPVIPPQIVVSSPASVWNYTGCYTELQNARALTGYTFTNATSMTVDLCVGTCASKGYLFGGIEYGQECYCGNTLSTASTLNPDSQCQVMLCPGNKQQWCSTGSRLEVYQSS